MSSMVARLSLNVTQASQPAKNLSRDVTSPSQLHQLLFECERGCCTYFNHLISRLQEINEQLLFLLGDKVKVQVAIGFAIACAVLLLAIFILLLYKVLWFRSNSNGASKPPAKTVVQGRAPSVTEKDFRPTRQQRRHQPLMRSDSSASEIDLDNSWLRNNNLTSSESDSGSEPSLNLGKLEFNINYDTETECLRVTVVAARNLPSIHSTSYVELYLLPEKVEKHQTKIHYRNCSPVYNEEFQFDIGFSELAERTLQCCVFSYDGFSRHQSIGEVFYSFDEDDQLTEYSGVSLCKDIKRDVFLLKVSLKNNFNNLHTILFVVLTDRTL